MEWQKNNYSGGGKQTSWFKGTWFIDLPDSSNKLNAFFKSRAVWYPKGVLNISLNVHLPIRVHQEKSRKRVGRALADLFQTGYGWLCAISDGKLERGGQTIFTNVEWFTKCPQMPDADKVEQVAGLIESNLVAEKYLATVVATGQTETYEWQEMPWGVGMRAQIRESCGTGKVRQGRIWEIA